LVLMFPKKRSIWIPELQFLKVVLNHGIFALDESNESQETWPSCRSPVYANLAKIKISVQIDILKRWRYFLHRIDSYMQPFRTLQKIRVAFISRHVQLSQRILPKLDLQRWCVSLRLNLEVKWCDF
jgi:hypothetical protein